MAFDNETKVLEWRALLADGKKRLADQALNKLISSNDGLVYKVARRELKGRAAIEANLEEAVQEGRIGLLRAIQDFDSTKGRFTTFAGIWIRHHVQTCMAQQNDHELRRQAKMTPDMAKACNKIRLLEGREPTHEDLGVTREQWEAWHERPDLISVDATVQVNGTHDRTEVEGLDLCDAESSHSVQAYETRMISEQGLGARIEAAFEKLSPRNREITRALFLDGEPVGSIAKRFDISTDRVEWLRPVLRKRLAAALDSTSKRAA